MYNALKATYKKPTYVAEFGNGNGYKPNQPNGTDDPTGIYLNNGYWGGAASLGAGGCMCVYTAAWDMALGASCAHKHCLCACVFVD